MPKVLVTEEYLEDIADAIRAKNGTQNKYKPSQMADAIDDISGGGTTPSGTKEISITENGTTTEDVTNYASAEINVNVSAPSPTLQTKTVSYTPTTSAQSDTVTADNGYDGLSSVSISVSAMATGTEGTPTATKGTVNNNSVSVTPAVTNVAGYISGGTKTGTAVTVSASELVGGSLSITTNNTYDVTNYASAVVNVSSGGGSGITKTTGTVTGNGTNTIAITTAKSPDVAYVYRSDIDNMTAVAGKTNAASLYWDGGICGSAFCAENTTTLSNGGTKKNSGTGSGSTPSNVNSASYDGEKFYLKSGNNSYLWSSSLTYAYVFIFFS